MAVKLQGIELYVGKIKNIKYKLKELYDKLKKNISVIYIPIYIHILYFLSTILAWFITL